MSEEENRTGDPNKDAPPPSKTTWYATWGCLGLLVVLAIVIAIVSAGA